METLTLPSPAKVNRFLHILGRRPDGYHDLQTVFQILDTGDTLSLTRTEGPAVRVTGVTGVAEQDNLITRAARLLQERFQVALGAEIAVDKRLPMGGGLGGGSSNAATTLLGLNHLWELHRPLDELAELGLSLGADVPVFVHGHSAWAEGVGERLTPITTDEPWLVVLKPPCEVSTAKVFCHEGLTRNTSPRRIRLAFEGNAEGFHNDCESIVCKLYPDVEKALQWLRQFGNAQLTGTGSCVFCQFPTQSRALEVLASKPSGIKGFIAKGVNRSPLHNRLDELH